MSTENHNSQDGQRPDKLQEESTRELADGKALNDDLFTSVNATIDSHNDHLSRWRTENEFKADNHRASDASDTYSQATTDTSLSTENCTQIDTKHVDKQRGCSLERRKLSAELVEALRRCEQESRSRELRQQVAKLGAGLLCDHKDKVREPKASKGKPNDLEEGTDEPHVDKGYAWVVLTVMFLINASTFGSARAYSLIFERLARQEQLSRSEAALPFTIMGAVENMGGPLAGWLLSRCHSFRLTILLGSCLITGAHLLAAVFDSRLGQTLTIGVMCGLGLSLVSISSFQVNNAYFVRYRSRAFGLGLTGAAFGTFYISPLCQFLLDNYTPYACYLALGLILAPNIPLSLLLRPVSGPPTEESPATSSVSGQLAAREAQAAAPASIWRSVALVLRTPMFHLIWPTQLLFCWLNFVYGMIIVDFGKDRGLKCSAMLIEVWAIGQLFGRLGLGSLVDMRLISFDLFASICLAAISIASWSLNNSKLLGAELAVPLVQLLVFVLSMFIANLYILLNGLFTKHLPKSVATLSVGLSSFTGSFFLLPRASIIGQYRDTTGNYDAMLNMFAYISMLAALLWLLAPEVGSCCKRLLSRGSVSSQLAASCHSDGLICAPPKFRYHQSTG